MKTIIHEVILPIDLVQHARPPLNDDHQMDLIVIHYVLLPLPLKLIIQRSLLSYFLLLLARTFLLRQMFN